MFRRGGAVVELRQLTNQVLRDVFTTASNQEDHPAKGIGPQREHIGSFQLVRGSLLPSLEIRRGDARIMIEQPLTWSTTLFRLAYSSAWGAATCRVRFYRLGSHRCSKFWYGPGRPETDQVTEAELREAANFLREFLVTYQSVVYPAPTP